MTEGTEFTINLVNKAAGPALAMQKQMRDVMKVFDQTKRVLEAPASKSGALSDWQKMVSKARLSQIKDFSKSNAAAMRPPAVPAPSGGGLLDTLAGVAGGSLVVDALEAVGAAALGAVVGVAKLTASFVEAGLQGAAFADSSTKAIGYLTDNALHAGQVFDDVRHEAQDLGLDVNETVGSFQKLLAAQFSVGQSKSLIAMGADLRAIGASAEEVQRSIYAISEIKSIGTLQKRQERMLQMAGISGELIDKALMARTGIKTKGGIDLARKKNLIDADTAIEAIKDAVMMKTHEKAIGDVGRDRAKTQLRGMLDSFGAAIKNFWDDIGKKMDPGVTRIAKLISGTLGKLQNDPQIAGLGTFLLAKFEQFTVFVKVNWPQIETMLLTGFYLIADGIKGLTGTIEFFKEHWRLLSVPIELAAFGALAFAAALGAIALVAGVVVVGIWALRIEILNVLGTIVKQAVHWYKAGKDMIDALVSGLLAGIGPLGDVIAAIAAITGLALPAIQAKLTAAANPVAAATAPVGTAAKPLQLQADPEVLLSSLATGNINGVNVNSAFKNIPDKTEAGKPAAHHEVNIGEMILHVTSAAGDDPNATGGKIGAAIRAELQKMLKG